MDETTAIKYERLLASLEFRPVRYPDPIFFKEVVRPIAVREHGTWARQKWNEIARRVNAGEGR